MSTWTSEIPDAVTGEYITTTWGNQVRDQIVHIINDYPLPVTDVEAGALCFVATDETMWLRGATDWTQVDRPAILLDPPDVDGDYVGNTAIAPPEGAGQNGPSWLRWSPLTAPGTTTPTCCRSSRSTIRLPRSRPPGSTATGNCAPPPRLQQRIAFRVFEHHQAGGNSTQRFFEVSTNPTTSPTVNRLLGVYGTSHSTQPGWAVATRVLAGLLGVRAGGDYNGLSALNFRGLKTTSGAPTTGTWVLYDAVIDSTGALYVCTTAGTPGTWASSAGGGGGAHADTDHDDRFSQLDHTHAAAPDEVVTWPTGTEPSLVGVPDGTLWVEYTP